MKYSKEEKAMRLEDWRRSGMKAWTYAKANGIAPQTFANWAKKGAGDGGSFVEIPASRLTAMPPKEGLLIEKGEVKIHVPLPAGPDELRAILSALREAV